MKYMQYEKTAIKKRVGRKFIAEAERKALSQIKTSRILAYLYKRYEAEILYTGICVMFALLVWEKLA